MEITDVQVRRVAVPLSDQPGHVSTYTDVFMVVDGVPTYTRITGHDTPTSEGHHRAQYERRQKPGFYRKEG